MTITFTSGSLLGERISFDLKNAVLIGRSRSAQIRLREADVSGRHAEIAKSDDGVHITCHSRHGLRVNCVEVSMDESRPLTIGDEITIGRQVRFTVDDISDNVDETAIIVASQPKALSQDAFNATRADSAGSSDEISKLLDEVPKLDDLMAEDGPEKVSVFLNNLLSACPDNIYAKMLYGAYSLLLGREGNFKRVFDEIKGSAKGIRVLSLDIKTIEARRTYCQAYEKMYAAPAER